jgi:bacterioferritin-associated ferredoxin
MYICICNAVADHDIADAVRAGAMDMDDLEEILLVSTVCGKCREAAEACLKRCLTQQAKANMNSD